MFGIHRTKGLHFETAEGDRAEGSSNELGFGD